MRSSDAGERVVAAARETGLVRTGEPLLVLLSGGADSVCLLDVAVRLGAQVSALHVDHALRPDSGEDAVPASAALRVPSTCPAATNKPLTGPSAPRTVTARTSTGRVLAEPID